MNGYRHETIDIDEGMIGMSHFRLRTRPSGLVVATEIARSAAVYLTAADRLHTSSHLITPNPIARILENFATGGGDRQVKVLDTVDASDLRSFGRLGAEKWRRLVTELGITTSVELELKEVSSTTESTTPGGLVIPSEESKVEFQSYVATPDEIEALRLIEAKANGAIPSPEAGPQTGQFL